MSGKNRAFRFLMSLVLVFSTLTTGILPVSAAGSTFTDVPSGAYYAEAVGWAVDKEITKGTSSTTFSPDEGCTRGQCVTFLYRYAGSPEVDLEQASKFTDVKSKDFYASAVAWAVEQGVTSGTSETTFSPADQCTRAQIVTFLWRFNIEVKASQASTFNDVSSDKYYADAVSWAVEQEITRGTSDTTFSPETICNRAQIVTFLNRLDNALENSVVYPKGGYHNYVQDENNIVIDPDTYLTYINNELIIFAEKGTDKEKIEQLLSLFHGEIVGEIEDTDTYQVQLENAYSYSELKNIQSDLEDSPIVEWTAINTVFEEEDDYYPLSDKEYTTWVGEGGNNWGLKAIDAPGAWEYRDQMDRVNIGVYDNGFYNHEDLEYTQTFFNHQKKLEPKMNECSHGTHVAGIIGAGFDNEKGITGIVPKANLYAFSYNTSEIMKNKSDLMCYLLALHTLIHESQCKVINISQNTGKLIGFAASRGNQKAQMIIENNAYIIGRYLQMLLNIGDDFVICVAAGNNNNKQYIVDSSSIGYDYYIGLGQPESGNVDAKYNNYLNAISIPEVASRIIVVGSCKYETNYQHCVYSSFSNIGSRVDIVAPGEDIISTVNCRVLNEKKKYVTLKYKAEDGTSQAAPYVSGTAALVYAINPNLTGDEVKSIIIETGVDSVYDCDYKLLNACRAVEKAKSIDKNDSDVSIGTISDSWEQIIASVNNGTYKSKYKIGDTKALDLGLEGVIEMQIAAFDADELAYGSGKAAITWISKQLLNSNHRMNPDREVDPSDSSKYKLGTGSIGGWANSEMRSWLKSDIKPLIPSTVRNAIKPVVKYSTSYDEYRNSIQNESSIDDVWIPSFREVDATVSEFVKYESEGPTYSDLFASESDRIKKKSDDT